MTTDNDEPTLNGVESLDAYMEKNHNSLTSIKYRLPATLGADPHRAVICAIRNPDATVDEIAEATSTDEPDLYAGLLDLALDRDPDTDDLADAQRAVLDLTIDGEFDPDARRTDWESVARAAGRRAGTLTSKNPVRSFVGHEKFDDRLDRRKVEHTLAGRATDSDIRHLLDEIGLRRLLVALGEDPPEENLDDMPDTTQDDEPDDLTYLTERHTDADLEPGVEYHATVNNVTGYGVFVTVGGPPHDDISGLVHQSNMPPFIAPRDFEVGDQVSVYMTERRANGDLSFALASIIDAARFTAQQFAPNTEFVDRREDDEPEAPAPTGELEVDEDRPAEAARTGEWSGGEKAAAAVRNHGEWDEGDLFCRHCGGGPFDGGFGLAGHLGWCPEHGDTPEADPPKNYDEEVGPPKPETGAHEVLTLLDASGATDIDTGIMAADLRSAVTTIAGESVSSALLNLVEYDRVERESRPDETRYRHWVTDAGREYLDAIGRFWGDGDERSVERTDDEPADVGGGSSAGSHGSGAHEVLTVVGELAPPGGRYVPAAAVGQLVSMLQPQSASPALSRMYGDGLVEVDTEQAPGSGGVRRVYRLTGTGKALLDRMGPHPAHEPAETEPAPSSAEEPDAEPEPDIDPSTAEVSVRETVTPSEPEPGPQPEDELDDLRDDLLVRAAMLMGRHDLDARDVADTLREVAGRLEDRR